MKSFNVKKYNDEINKLNKMIETVDDLICLFELRGAEYNTSKEWFERLLSHPFAKIINLPIPMHIVDELQDLYGIDFEWYKTNRPKYTILLHQLDWAMKTQMEFLRLLPEIQKAYGSLFIYDGVECEMTKDAERLIMEQCIEWEEDYMDEEV